jgi:inositol phosphorylceramide glucuronosyltransferase 1
MPAASLPTSLMMLVHRVAQSRAVRAVVFLDADTIVIQNMDEVFKCPGFCAALRHSERFNSGVMVIHPSKELFQRIMDSIATFSSYTG